MRKDQYKISNAQLAVFNEKHKQKLLFSGCEEWMKRGGSHPTEVGILLSFTDS